MTVRPGEQPRPEDEPNGSVGSRLRQLAAKATPGEWKVAPPLTKGILFPSGRDRAAEYRSMPTEADARLIALSPDLAARLADATTALETLAEAVEMAGGELEVDAETLEALGIPSLLARVGELEARIEGEAG